jgi:NADPH-dependent 2,4-dienoyl-CoA reductase/sulfur reductase-like enzyme
MASASRGQWHASTSPADLRLTRYPAVDFFLLRVGECRLAKRVAVVGAGPSGLVTVKELLEEGHEPACFERAAGLGGVFRFGERDPHALESWFRSRRRTAAPRSSQISPIPSPRAGHGDSLP